MKNYLYQIITGKRTGFDATCVRLVLRFLSLVYGVVVFILELAWRVGLLRGRQLSRPVISVGNITWGGVGKTPVVIGLARYIQKRGLRPAILMRGYKGRKAADRANEYANDEALMVKTILPGVVLGIGSDRIKEASRLLAQDAPDIFLLDDGFQHRAVKRDLDIVTVDATNPYGNGWLIPGGILREPLTALRRADVFILTKTDFVGQENLQRLERQLRFVNPRALIAHSVHAPAEFEDLKTREVYPLSHLAGQAVASCASIGDPQNFEETLGKLGIKVNNNFRFPDHDWYRESDLKSMAQECERAGIRFFVTTMKDAAKLTDGANIFPTAIQCLVLKIDLRLTRNEGDIFARIDSLLQR